jgi:hypothetical protein
MGKTLVLAHREYHDDPRPLAHAKIGGAQRVRVRFLKYADSALVIPLANVRDGFTKPKLPSACSGSTMVTCTMQGRMMILLQKQQLVHKGRSRDQIMAAVPDNVLGRGDRHN